MARMKELELRRLVDEMTTSMLGSGIDGEVEETLDEDQHEVIGCVHLSDDPWSGSILVSMTREAANAATATMFMLGEDEVDESLVADAMGEFANVLAGMIKTEIGGGCQLSLPTVTAGAGLRFAVPGTVVVDRRRFGSAVGPIGVATMERQ